LDHHVARRRGLTYENRSLFRCRIDLPLGVVASDLRELQYHVYRKVRVDRIVDSLRPDKPGQMRVFASDGSEFTAGQALWMKGQLRSVLQACVQGDESSAASSLHGVTDLLHTHHRAL